MARTYKILVSLAVVGAVGFGAYAARGLWLAKVEQMLGRAPSATTAERPAAGSRRQGGRRNGGQAQLPTSVLATDARAMDVPVFIDGVGSVKPLNTVTIRPQVSGKLLEIHFDEGEDIKKGDVLARIDDAVYRAALDQANGKKAQDEALLANAQLDLERYQRLVQSSSGTQQQADTAKSQVAQYRAAVQSDTAAIASAQASLDYTIIKAPIDGRTGIRNVDIGNIVSASDTTGIVTLSQIKPISVVFSVPQQQLARVNAAMGSGKLSVEATAGDGKTVIDTGTLEVVDNQVDTTTGTVKLKANFANEKLALWPGAFVNARLLVETMKGAIVVPTAAVQRGPDGTFVYLLKPDQTVAMHTVKVGQQDDAQAVITEGLAAGDKVVTTGFARLQDGAKVTIGDAQPAVASEGTETPGAGQRPNRRRNSGEQPPATGTDAATPGTPSETRPANTSEATKP